MANRLTLTDEGDIVTREQKKAAAMDKWANKQTDKLVGGYDEKKQEVAPAAEETSRPGSSGIDGKEASRPGTSGYAGPGESRPGSSGIDGKEASSQGYAGQGESRPGTSASQRSKGSASASIRSHESRPGTSSSKRSGASAGKRVDKDGWEFVKNLEPCEAPDDIEACDPEMEAMMEECEEMRGVAVTTSGVIKMTLPPRDQWISNPLPGKGTYVWNDVPDFVPDDLVMVKMNVEREIWKKATILGKREEEGDLYNIKIGERIYEKIQRKQLKPADTTIPPSVLRFSWLSVEDMFAKGYWLAVSGGADGLVKVWNLRSQECVGTCVGHDGPVHTIDGDFLRRRAITGGSDGVVRVWDVENCQQLYALYGHSRAVLSVKADFFRGKALSSSVDATVKMWDLKNKKCIFTLEGHGERIPVCLVDFVRQAAITGSWDGELRLWDLKRQYCRQVLRGHTDKVHCLSADFKIGRAVSASEDGDLRLWDFVLDFKDIRYRPRTPDPDEIDPDDPDGLKTPESEQFQAEQASVSSEEKPEDLEGGAPQFLEGGVAIEGTEDQQRPQTRESQISKGSSYYKIPQTPCVRVLSTLSGHKDAVTTACVDFLAGRVLSGSHDETLRLWEIPRGSDQRDALGGVEPSPEEGELDEKALKGPVKCRSLGVLRGHTLPITVVRADFRRDIAVSGSDDLSVRVWSLREMKCTNNFQGADGHTGYVIAMSSDFPRFRVVTTSSDYTLRLWNVEKMHADGAPMVGHVRKVNCVFTNSLTDDLVEEEKEKEKEKQKAEQKERQKAEQRKAEELKAQKEQEDKERTDVPQPQDSN